MRLFVESSTKVPIVSVAIAFQSGSTHDPVGKEGLCRATARMLRRGSEGLSADQVEEAFDSLGGEFGCDASTGSISVHAEVISRNLRPFASLVTKVLGTPAFDGAEAALFAREAKAEIVESRDNDRVLASRGFRRALFAGHPYARRVAGSIASLEDLEPSHMRAFYERHMCRKNAVVAVSGDISEPAARELAAELLSGLPEGERIEDEVKDPEPARGRRLVLIDKQERTQTQMVVGWLGTHPHDEDHLAWIVGNTSFGGTFTSRLMQEVRAKRGWSYGANSRVGFDRHRDAFVMWSAPGQADAAACLELEIDLLETLKRDGLSAEELAFTKNYLERSYAFEIDTARKRVQQRMEEALYDFPEGYHERYLQRLAALSLDEVNAALRARTPHEDLVVTVVATDSVSGDALQAAVGKGVSSAPPRLVEAYDVE